MPASAFPVHAGLPFAGRSGEGGPSGSASVAELTQNKTSVQLVNEFYVRHKGHKHIDWEQVPGLGGTSPCAWICNMQLAGGSVGDWRLPDASFRVEAATKKLAERDTCQQAWDHLLRLGLVTEATLTSTMGANTPSWEVPKRWNDSNPLVYIDVSSQGAPVGRVVLELFADVVPQAAALFTSLLSAGSPPCAQGCSISQVSHGAHTSSLELHLTPQAPAPGGETSQGCEPLGPPEFLLVHQRRFLLTYRPAAAASSQPGPGQATPNGTEHTGEQAAAAATADGAEHKGEEAAGAAAVDPPVEQSDSEQSQVQPPAPVPVPSPVGSLHITMTPVPALNGTYEVVGQVLKGFGALRTLQEQMQLPGGGPPTQVLAACCVSQCGVLSGDLQDIAVDEEGGLPMWPDDLPDQAHANEGSEVEMRVSAAACMREAGNAAFQAGQYKPALRKYTQAVRYLHLWSIRSCLHRNMDYELKQLLLQDTDKCLLNRAACYLKLNQHLQADADCRQVLAHQPSQPKALFRLGQASMGLGRVEEAVEHLTAAARLEPQNAAVRGVLEEAKQELRERKAKEGAAYARIWAAGEYHAEETGAVQFREVEPAAAVSGGA